MAKSSSYKLRVPDGLAATIRSMHPGLKKKIRDSLETIISDPSSGKVLKDELAGLRSFKVGRFRIIYRIKGKEIELVSIGPRSRIYEETFRLLKLG